MDILSLIVNIIDPVRFLIIFIVLALYTETSENPKKSFIITFTTIFSAIMAWISCSVITSKPQTISLFLVGLTTSYLATILMSKTLFKDVLYSNNTISK